MKAIKFILSCNTLLVILPSTVAWLTYHGPHLEGRQTKAQGMLKSGRGHEDSKSHQYVTVSPSYIRSYTYKVMSLATQM